MKKIKIWRIENIKTNAGMWYDIYGKPNKVIDSLTEGKSKAMDMPHSFLHTKDGKQWFSGVGSIEGLMDWFSAKDIEELLSWGYQLYELEITDYNILEFEVLFTSEGIISQTVIDYREYL